MGKRIPFKRCRALAVGKTQVRVTASENLSQILSALLLCRLSVMGVTGLYAYLNNRAPAAAEQCTVKRTTTTEGEAPQRIVLIDANGLYHHLLFSYCGNEPRSLGGEWRALAAASRRFLWPFQLCGCQLAAVFDGCASRAEGKSSTRVQRARDRRAKMKRFDLEVRARLEAGEPSGAQLPAGCLPVMPREESLLPVPAGTLQSFLQILQSLNIPCWSSDGENDEYIAALAVQFAHTGVPVTSGASSSSAASSTPIRRVPVDVLGQDSDFLVFDTRTVEGLRQADSVEDDTAAGYVPLESLRFHEADESDRIEESIASRISGISFKRYSTSSVCSALSLPPCLLPSLACLVGNDSSLDLLHFHMFTHSPGFARLLRDSSTNGRLGALAKAGS
jgi:hypothetical protein